VKAQQKNVLRELAIEDTGEALWLSEAPKGVMNRFEGKKKQMLTINEVETKVPNG